MTSISQRFPNVQQMHGLWRKTRFPFWLPLLIFFGAPNLFSWWCVVFEFLQISKPQILLTVFKRRTVPFSSLIVHREKQSSIQLSLIWQHLVEIWYRPARIGLGEKARITAEVRTWSQQYSEKKKKNVRAKIEERRLANLNMMQTAHESPMAADRWIQRIQRRGGHLEFRECPRMARPLPGRCNPFARRRIEIKYKSASIPPRRWTNLPPRFHWPIERFPGANFAPPQIASKGDKKKKKDLIF